jgi:hypothetical protein
VPGTRTGSFVNKDIANEENRFTAGNNRSVISTAAIPVYKLKTAIHKPHLNNPGMEPTFILLTAFVQKVSSS